jgi:hypothetical protein
MEESGCCLVVTQVVEACQGLEPPPGGGECEIAACESDGFCQDAVDSSSLCVEGCCTPPDGGGGELTCIPECNAGGGDQCLPGPPGFEDVGFCFTPTATCPDLGADFGIRCGSGPAAQTYCTIAADFFGPSTCTEGCCVPDPLPPPP